MESHQPQERYLRPIEVTELLKVSLQSLVNWERHGKLKCVRTQGGHRRYLLSDIIQQPEYQGGLKVQPLVQKKNIEGNVCYCRVSSQGQKADLERQVAHLRLLYPHHRIIRDIGSGLNFKRKGLSSLVEQSLHGRIREIVVTHRDRLCRFGFELLEKIIESNHGKIVVLNQAETSPEGELCNDLLSIITVFSSRLYGLRAHSIKRKIKEAASKPKNSEDSTLSDSGGEGDDQEDASGI